MDAHGEEGVVLRRRNVLVELEGVEEDTPFYISRCEERLKRKTW